MAAHVENIADKYLIAMRMIQPARVQDVRTAVSQIWPSDRQDAEADIIAQIHGKLLADGALVSVRRGTYVLTLIGMQAAARAVKARKIDNARLFLMKAQRKRYHGTARWLG